MKKSIKIIGYFSGVILLLLLLLFLSISSGILNPGITGMVNLLGSRQLNGSLLIERIEGNLLSDFSINNIQITQDNEAVVDIHSIFIKLDLWQLKDKKIKIEQLHVNQTKCNIVQREDSLWNISSLFVSDESPSDESSPLGFTIELDDIQINAFEVSIEALDSAANIPKNIQMNTALNVVVENNNVLLNLEEFNLKTLHPEFQVQNLIFRLELRDSILTWEAFELKLARSHFSSSGRVPFNNYFQSQADISASPLDLSDFQPWLPQLYGQPEIKMQIINKAGTSTIAFDLMQEEQKLKILANIQEDSLPTYRVSLETDSLNLASWTRQPELISNIKGSLSLEGIGFEYQENSMNASAQFQNLHSNLLNLNQFSFSTQKEKGDLALQLKIGGGRAGTLSSNISIVDLFETPVYDAALNLQHIDLSKFTALKEVDTDLNLNIKANGKGKDPENMHADILLKLSNSSFLNEAIADMHARINIAEQQYSIKGLNLATSFLVAEIAAHGNIAGNNSLNYFFKLKDTKPVLIKLGLPPIHFEGTVKGEIAGPVNALAFKADLNIREFVSDSLALQNAKATISTRFSLDPKDQFSHSPNAIPFLTKITPENLNTDLKGTIDRFSIGNYHLDTIHFFVHKKGERLNGAMSSLGAMGKLKAEFQVQQLFSIPTYTVQSSLKNINLSQLTGNDSLDTDLNLDILARGSGMSQETLNMVLDLKSTDSFVLGDSLQDFHSTIRYNKGAYQIENLELNTGFLIAHLEGEGYIDVNNQLHFFLKVKDQEKLNAALVPLKFKVRGELQAKVDGSWDSLNITSSIKLEQLQLDSIQVESLSAAVNFKKRKLAYSGEINLQLKSVFLQGLGLETVELIADFDQDKAFSSFSYKASDSLKGSIQTETLFEESPTIYFNEITLDFPKERWKGGDNQTFIRLGKDSIKINKLNIASAKGAFKAEGIFSFHGQEDLRIQIEDLDLAGIGKSKFSPIPFAGKLNGTIAITGTAENPILDGGVSIHHFEIDSLHFKEIAFTSNYDNEHLMLSAFVDDTASRMLSSHLKIPYRLSFTDSISMPPPETPLDLSLKVNDFDLSKLSHFLPAREATIKGELNIDLKGDNTIANPQARGTIALNGGMLHYEKLGMYYESIAVNTHLNKKQITLDSLSIASRKGTLKMKGLAEVDSLLQGDLNYINLELQGENFELFDSEMATALINTHLNVKGSPKKSEFDGKLTIVRTDANVDLLIKEFDKAYDDAEQPMLIAARNASKDKAPQREAHKDTLSIKAPDFFKNLKGQFDIEIPQNAWVRGKSMNLELAGNLKVLKEREDFAVFGAINVKRGYYKIYGRQLDFEEGELTFTGGAEINPLLNFKLAYRFRDPEKNLRKLTVYLTDRLLQPKIDFYMDGVVIEEKEAISYLVFNKGLNQLDTEENNSVENSNMNLAFGQLSNVLKNALQSNIGLDVIEIKGNEDWSNSTLSAGKYLTNKLFLNYERTFSINKKDKVVDPDKVSLEYQFLPSLFLQAINQRNNSGFDLIFKWTWR